MGEGKNMSAGKNDSSRMLRQKRSLVSQNFMLLFVLSLIDVLFGNGKDLS